MGQREIAPEGVSASAKQDTGSGPSASPTKPSRKSDKKGVSTGSRNSGLAARGSENEKPDSSIGQGIVTCLVVIAAIAAAYWTATSTSGDGYFGKPAPPNAALRAVAQQMLHPSKGILAADESPATFGKRLSPTVRNNAGLRRRWRHTLLTTPGLEGHVSAVILHEETFAQLPEEIAAAVARGVAVGAKLDTGTVAMQPKKAGERATQGLEGLSERCRRLRDQGASFAKWRAVFRVGPHTPSKAAVNGNAHDMAEYAAVTQECGLVPILEPEVLAEGDHDMTRGSAAATRVLRGLVRALRRRAGVDLGAVLLKVALVTPGEGAAEQAAPEQVANATLRVLLRTVPRVVPGILFLSGGQSEDTATANLLALGKLVRERAQAGKPPLPWALSFSFGRALQTSALAAWQAGDEAAAQAALLDRVRANARAQQGLGAEDGEAAAEGKEGERGKAGGREGEGGEARKGRRRRRRQQVKQEATPT